MTKREERMSRKCIISAVVMFVMALALSFFIHGFLLFNDYAAAGGMRPPEQAHSLMHYMILAQVLFSGAFAWVYVQGRDDKAWLGQGLRYGIAIACLTVIPTYLIYHVVTPVPFALAIKQIIYDTIRVLLMGVVLAWINR
jgi:hypothetical protein